MANRSDTAAGSLIRLRETVLEACRNGDLGQVKAGLATPDFFPSLSEDEIANHHFSLAIPGSASAQHLLHRLIETCCKSGQANVLRHLTLAFPIKPLDEGDLWVVLGAIRSGSPETLEVLCEADPHLVDLNFSHYGSPLGQAIIMYDQSKAAAMVEVLLQAGASLADKATANVITRPVLSAVRYCPPAVFEIMMRFGGEAYVEDINLLFEATEHANYAMVIHLLNSGEDVNAVETSSSGRSALFAAAAKGRDQFVLYLLHRGASPFVAGPEGQLPVDVARMNGHTNITEIFEQWNGGSKVFVNEDQMLALR